MRRDHFGAGCSERRGYERLERGLRRPVPTHVQMRSRVSLTNAVWRSSRPSRFCASAARLCCRVGGGVAAPLPSRTRACASNALGSSHGRFAQGKKRSSCGGADARPRQGVPPKEFPHLVPVQARFPAAAREPFPPCLHNLAVEARQPCAVAPEPVVVPVPPQHAREMRPLHGNRVVPVSATPVVDGSHRAWSIYEVSDYLGCGSYGSRVVPEVECTS